MKYVMRYTFLTTSRPIFALNQALSTYDHEFHIVHRSQLSDLKDSPDPLRIK